MRPPARTPELGLICESRAMPRFATEHEHVAPSDVSVLIWGEPGVGKERAARALHERSSRGVEPLEVIRCSGLDGAALQTELRWTFTPHKLQHWYDRHQGQIAQGF